MIKEIHTREGLNEGRCTELAFGFVKKKKENFETLMVISPCKDYLNDFVHGEKFKIPKTPKVHGFTHEYMGCFNHQLPRIGFKIVGYYDETTEGYGYDEYDKYCKLLDKNWKNAEYLLKSICRSLKLGKCNIIKVDSNRYVLVMNKKCIQYSYIVSLLTFAIRVGIHMNKPVNWQSLNKKYILNNNLQIQWPKTVEKLKAIKSSNELPDNNHNKTTSISKIHSGGWLSLKLPTND